MRQYLCFKCGQSCRTIYELEGSPRFIQKECRSCGWKSHPQVIPEVIEWWIVPFVVKIGMSMIMESLYYMKKHPLKNHLMMRFTICAVIDVWKGGWTYELQVFSYRSLWWMPSSGRTLGWRRMSRKRSTDKAIPISVALPGSLVKRLDQELSYQASRSKYVAKAIENRLKQMENSAVSEASTRQLMAALMARKDITNQLRLILETLVSN